MESKKITEEDLSALKELQGSINLSKISTKNLELEYENKILRLYLKYELKLSDSINVETGEIISQTQVG